jgi:formate/nitrite transporter FocA (FNT family)
MEKLTTVSWVLWQVTLSESIICYMLVCVEVWLDLAEGKIVPALLPVYENILDFRHSGKC